MPIDQDAKFFGKQCLLLFVLVSKLASDKLLIEGFCATGQDFGQIFRLATQYCNVVPQLSVSDSDSECARNSEIANPEYDLT